MNICNEIAALGHDTTAFFPAIEPKEKVNDVYSFYGVSNLFRIERLFFPAFKGRSTFFSLHFIAKLKKMNPDLVTGRSVHGCTIAALLGYPTVFDTHGPIWESGKFPLKLFRIMIRQRSFKKMVVNSHALKEIYVRSDIFKGSGFDPGNIQVAHNGSQAFPLETQIELPGDKSRFKVGYFGQLYKGRGIDIIINIAQQMSAVDFYVVGGEEKDIIDWKSKIKSKNIYFIGFVPYPEVYKYRNSCDVLLAPYQEITAPEGVTGNQTPYMNPIKILEYMSSRKPVIASDLPTIREVLNEKNSILVDCANSTEWVSAIKRLMVEKTYAKSLAEQSYKEFAECYTWKARAQKLIDIT
ncbi:glycosyltransferase [Anseongella ginsenosidimutans]|nr:glycosyltransferase [Anseongella ginsenosidimutans]